VLYLLILGGRVKILILISNIWTDKTALCCR